MHRSGAALILALILLAALLLMGLPFLFSQSSSLSGTRSFADSKSAQIARDSSENLAVAIAAYAIERSLRVSGPPDLTDWSSLAGTFAPENLLTPPSLKNAATVVNAYDIALKADQLAALGYNAPNARVLIGATIVDEAGKLNPNAMSAEVWARLFQAPGVQILDWDDNDVVKVPNNTSWGEDGDKLPQLAQALAELRQRLPGGRITHLEQLLEADPQQGGVYKNLRHRLTRAELEVLRPYLTLHNPGPGRRGLIDLGSVVFDDPSYPTWYLDSNPPDAALITYDTALVGEPIDPVTKAHARAFVRGGISDAPVVWSRRVSSDQLISGTGQLVAIEAPGAINFHQMSSPVRVALSSPSMAVPAPIPDASIPADAGKVKLYRTYGSLNAVFASGTAAAPVYLNLFPWTSPLGLAGSGNPRTSETPPIGIRSIGVVSVEASSTAMDPLGRQTAQEIRRDVVQAVPQEHLLEDRWITQSQIDASLAQRFGSHVQSWPVASQRRQDVPPDDPDLSIPKAPMPLTGLRSAPLIDIATQLPAKLKHVKLDWKVTFGADKAMPDAEVFNTQEWNNAGAAAPRRTPYRPAAPASAAVDMRPDGYYHGPSADLAYTLHGNGDTDVLRDRKTDVTHEMSARHLSLWIKPEGDWNGSMVVPIFEARIPAANAITISTVGAPANTGSQNYLGLFYDAKNKLLVLATAPPTAENTVDYWKPSDPLYANAVFPMDDPLTPEVDERCLSKTYTTLTPLAPLAPRAYASGGPAAAVFPLFEPNRILHLFKTPDDSSGSPHFRRDQWYHVQIALADNRPEGTSIILDGIVGQDVTKQGVAQPELKNFGDHCVFPSLVLTGSTPASGTGGSGIPFSVVTKTNVADLGLKKISVVVPKILEPLGGTQLTAKDVLPERGMVRIDDEYILYESIAADGLSLDNCQRGQRQNTNIFNPALVSQLYPNLQGHMDGALVVPGGYRLNIPTFPIGGSTNKIYRGGCTTVDMVTNGDPMVGPGQWQVWSEIDESQSPPITTSGPNWDLPAASATIPLRAGAGVPGQFPITGGIVKITFGGASQYRSYATASGTTLSGVLPLTGWVSAPANPITAIPPSDFLWLKTSPSRPTVTLISIHVKDNDPTQPGRYSQRSVGNAIQLQEPTGRIEWIGYDCIMKANAAATDGYFVQNGGYGPGYRGIQRTPFPDKDATLTAVVFAGGCKVIPVQTEFGNPGHMVATGDVVTLLPRTLAIGAGAPKPLQMAVRYAAGDGYTGEGDAASDSKNEYFAFSDFLPDAAPGQNGATDVSLDAGKYEMLCGDCWSGDDLTPLNPEPQPRAYLPRIDLWSDNYALGAGSSARLWFGSDANGSVKADMTIDCISAGKLSTSSTLGNDWDGHESGAGPNTRACGIERFFKAGIPAYSIGPDIGDITGIIAQATTPLFDFSLGNMGLVLIQGEVFAYQRPSAAESATIAASLATLKGTVDNTGILVYTAAEIQTKGMFAKLVGRGLLDVVNGAKVGIPHDIADGPVIDNGARAPHRPLLEAIRLPLGPVLRCADDLTAHQWHTLTDVDASAPTPVPVVVFDAPAALMCSAAGEVDKAEIVQFIGPNQRVVRTGDPPNLDQGRYTTADWLRSLYNTTKNTWAKSDSPLVIGWWPRYASALPVSTSTVKQHFGCRSYAWVGFPVTVYGGYFTKGLLDSFPAAGPFPYRNEPMAEVVVSQHFNGFFDVEARALGDDNDWSTVTWSRQQPISLVGSSDASNAFLPPNDVCSCFSSGGVGALTAKPVDGAELRVTWHYTQALSSNLRSIAESGDRSPVIDHAKVRYLAPVRFLANERAR